MTNPRRLILHEATDGLAPLIRAKIWPVLAAPNATGQTILLIYKNLSLVRQKIGELLEKLKTHLLELQLQRTNLLTRFEPSYRPVLEIDQQIEQAKTSIAGEGLTPVRDETTDKDPNYEWARMELEKAEVHLQGLQAKESDATAQAASLRTTAQQMQASSIDQQA